MIETTGLADPAPIMATLVADPMLRHHFVVGNIVTVVDAENGFASLDAYRESLRQVAVADRLVVTKIDLAAPDTVSQLVGELSVINPTAEIVTINEDSEASANLLTDDVHDTRTRSEQVARWLALDANDHGHHHGHVDRNRHGDIQAMLLSADQPVDWAAFALWLSMLLHRHGAEILRVKGLLSLAGQSAPVVVQGVQHLIHKPVHLDRWPDGRAQTRIVVIVHGLDPDLIQRSSSPLSCGLARSRRRLRRCRQRKDGPSCGLARSRRRLRRCRRRRAGYRRRFPHPLRAGERARAATKRPPCLQT